MRFELVGAMPSIQPDDGEKLFFGTAALRFAKTIGNKLERGDADQGHVVEHPYAITLTDFHAPARAGVFDSYSATAFAT